MPIITSPVQEVPASLVILLVAATLMLSTLSTALWLSLDHASSPVTPRATSANLAAN